MFASYEKISGQLESVKSKAAKYGRFLPSHCGPELRYGPDGSGLKEQKSLINFYDQTRPQRSWRA